MNHLNLVRWPPSLFQPVALPRAALFGVRFKVETQLLWASPGRKGHGAHSVSSLVRSVGGFHHTVCNLCREECSWE